MPFCFFVSSVTSMGEDGWHHIEGSTFLLGIQRPVSKVLTDAVIHL